MRQSHARTFAAALTAMSIAFVTTPVAARDVPSELHKLLPDDGAFDDLFGYSVAVSGDYVVVGAYRDDDNGDDSGAAYVFDAVTGAQHLKLLATDGAANDEFGYSVAVSGGVAIVGAYFDDDNGTNSGSAYLFDVATGQQLFKLLPTDGVSTDRFGWSVAISGGVAIVGAYNDDDNGTNSGSAYLFDVATGQQLFKLLPTDGAAGDRFGWSVGISGGVAVVGAYLNDDAGTSSGSAYLFDVATGLQLFKLLPDDGAVGDQFGYSVATTNTIAIVGAVEDDDNGFESGSAFLFDVATGAQLLKLLPNDGAQFDDFGTSVAISGEIALVGAPGNNDNGGSSGSSYFFDTATGLQLYELLPSDGAMSDQSGISVAISGSVAVVGAWLNDDFGTNSGAAYLFYTGPGGSCTSDTNGDGVVDFADFSVVLSNYGGPANGPGEGDFTSNDIADFDDFSTLLGVYGQDCPDDDAKR